MQHRASLGGITAIIPLLCVLPCRCPVLLVVGDSSPAVDAVVRVYLDGSAAVLVGS